MFGLMIFVHIIASILLIVIILMQSGRGGGLTEGLAAGAESIFGSKTNVFMTRATTGLAVAFLVTCLSLALLSTQRSKSLMDKVPAAAQGTAAGSAVVTPAAPEAVAEAPKAEPKKEDIVPTPVNQATN